MKLIVHLHELSYSLLAEVNHNWIVISVEVNHNLFAISKSPSSSHSYYFCFVNILLVKNSNKRRNQVLFYPIQPKKQKNKKNKRLELYNEGLPFFFFFYNEGSFLTKV